MIENRRPVQALIALQSSCQMSLTMKLVNGNGRLPIAGLCKCKKQKRTIRPSSPCRSLAHSENPIIYSKRTSLVFCNFGLVLRASPPLGLSAGILNLFSSPSPLAVQTASGYHLKPCGHCSRQTATPSPHERRAEKKKSRITDCRSIRLEGLALRDTYGQRRDESAKREGMANEEIGKNPRTQTTGRAEAWA